MVTKLFLRTADWPAMRGALLAALPSYQDDDGEVQPMLTTPTYQAALLPGLCASGPDGEPEPIPGYHANLITSDQSIIDALAPITIHPRSPLVGWARQ